MDEAGDIVKRRLGAVDSWETPRAPFEARALPRHRAAFACLWQDDSYQGWGSLVASMTCTGLLPGAV